MKQIHLLILRFAQFVVLTGQWSHVRYTYHNIIAKSLRQLTMIWKLYYLENLLSRLGLFYRCCHTQIRGSAGPSPVWQPAIGKAVTICEAMTIWESMTIWEAMTIREAMAVCETVTIGKPVTIGEPVTIRESMDISQAVTICKAIHTMHAICKSSTSETVPVSESPSRYSTIQHALHDTSLPRRPGGPSLSPSQAQIGISCRYRCVCAGRSGSGYCAGSRSGPYKWVVHGSELLVGDIVLEPRVLVFFNQPAERVGLVGGMEGLGMWLVGFTHVIHSSSGEMMLLKRAYCRTIHTERD